MSRRRKIPTPSWEHSQSGTLAGRLDTNRWRLLATGAVVALVLAALAVVGWAFLSDYIEDQQRPGSTALEVAGHEWTVEEFTRRAEMYVDENGGQNNAFIVIPTVTNQLTTEAIVLEFAPAEGVTATDEEINENIASRLGITADDPNFDARLAEELDATGLSEEEYRDISRADVLRANLTLKFRDELPASVPSVNYRQIRVADQATADGLVTQLEGGADFATLYAENSLDYSEGDETGGEEGFTPEGLLDENLESFLFGLEDGEISTYATNNAVLVVQKIAESETEPLTDAQKDQLAANAFDDWEQEKEESLEITDELDFQEGDPDKLAWVVENAGLVVTLQ